MLYLVYRLHDSGSWCPQQHNNHASALLQQNYCSPRAYHKNFLWDSSLTTSNRCAYSTGFQTFRSFLLMTGLWVPGSSLLPPILNEDTLIYFVAHCTQILHPTYQTIKLLSSWYLAFIFTSCVHTPLTNISSLLRLKNILKGVRKVQCDYRQKLPITYYILCDIWQCLQHYGLSEYTKLLLQTGCALAFYAFWGVMNLLFVEPIFLQQTICVCRI